VINPGNDKVTATIPVGIGASSVGGQCHRHDRLRGQR
jgi:hypothetical protein